MLAERKLGLLMAAQKAAGLMAKGGQPFQSTGSKPDPVEDVVREFTLAEVGIDKHLADRARKAAALDEDEFEDRIADVRERIIAPAL